MESLNAFVDFLYRSFGINLIHLTDDFERGRLLWGMWKTVELSLYCMVASIVIGIAGALLQMSRFTVVRTIAQAYIQFFRNTPPLVQLYFFFFALSPLLPRVMTDYGIERPMFSAFVWAAISLSFFAGAFNVEIFRSGIEAVPKTMTEAAQSIGLRNSQIFRLVTLPLAVRVCLPALTSNMINLVKTTTLAYAISVPETLFVASQIWSDRANVFEMMMTLFVFYIALVGILAYVMERWERSLRIPGFGR
jgi:polar amino acid transport system permease protein